MTLSIRLFQPLRVVGCAVLIASHVAAQEPAGTAALVRLAQEGNPSACYALGLAHESGAGRVRDLSEAARLYGIAASAGIASAQARLAYLYQTGAGVRRDLSKALELYRQAAATDADAQFQLALALVNGTGTPADPASGRLWLAKAATADHQEAQLMLGLMMVDASRLYLATAFPLGLVGLLVERKLRASSLHRARSRARRARVLVVGGERAAQTRRTWFTKHRTAGYEVCGVWVPDESMPLAVPCPRRLAGLPVMSSRTDFAEASAISGPTTVMVTDTEHLGHESLRDLAWQLEGSRHRPVLSPNVLNVSSSRLLPAGRLRHADAARE